MFRTHSTHAVLGLGLAACLLLSACAHSENPAATQTDTSGTTSSIAQYPQDATPADDTPEVQAAPTGDIQAYPEQTGEPAPEDGLDLSPESALTGGYYSWQDLYDQQTGVALFSAFVPTGWSAQLQSNWDVVSVAAPGFVEVTLTSPDGMADITIDSCQAFTQQPSGIEGSDFATYTTYLNYLDPGQFTDTYMNAAFGDSAELAAEFPSDADTLSQLEQYSALLVDAANQEGAAMTAGGTIGGVNSVSEPYDAGMCRRLYRVGEQRLETTVVEVAVAQYISGPALEESFLHWRVPYSIVFRAANETAFEEYYDEYEMIVANSQFTSQYYSAEEYVSKTITAMAMDAKAAASATSSFSSSGYESASAESTNEKIINMWDDVINEVDTYTTLDGGTVKTSMYNDVVAQSGDEFFVGSSTSDIPSGFTELSKSY